MTVYVPRTNLTATPPRCYCLSCDWNMRGADATQHARAHTVETGHRVKAELTARWEYQHQAPEGES